MDHHRCECGGLPLCRCVLLLLLPGKKITPNIKTKDTICNINWRFSDSLTAYTRQALVYFSKTVSKQLLRYCWDKKKVSDYRNIQYKFLMICSSWVLIWYHNKKHFKLSDIVITRDYCSLDLAHSEQLQFALTSKINVNVYVYSLDIPFSRVQQTAQFTPLVSELTLIRSHLLWGEFSAFSAANDISQCHFTFHNSPFFRSTRYPSLLGGQRRLVWEALPNTSTHK